MTPLYGIAEWFGQPFDGLSPTSRQALAKAALGLDWRSSSAKRLMPQLQVKAPTLRRWGTKLAVAVDLPFFESIGGPTDNFSHDLNDGDIIWLVPMINDSNQLVEHHWEALSLEESSDKLLSAKTVRRHEFETVLRTKLQRIQTRD